MLIATDRATVWDSNRMKPSRAPPHKAALEAFEPVDLKTKYT